VQCCAYRKDTQELISGSSDGLILVWTCPSGSISREKLLAARSKQRKAATAANVNNAAAGTTVYTYLLHLYMM
jgi:hypothetical protein